MTTSTITGPSVTPVGTSTGLFLRYLLLLRTCALSGLILSLAAAYYILGIIPPIVPITSMIVALGAFTLVSWWRMKAGVPIPERTIRVQLLIDILALTVVLYFTGGSVNPFVSLFLLPVTVASATLRSNATWLIAAAAAFCYTGLMFIHLPAPQWGYVDHHHFAFHLWGMWFGFVLSAAIVAYFVARMGNTLRAHDQELARAREQALQANQLVALGALAAGTAHQLGTPLATMAILAKEMERELTAMPDLTQKLHLLRDEINRCKAILAQMASQAGQAKAEEGHLVTLDRYLEELLVEWRKLRPETLVKIRRVGPEPAPSIIADRTLTQAIINVLNNAADAAAKGVEIDAKWEHNQLTIEIRDDGPGLPASIRHHIGKPFFTTKPAGAGMGLGLYLTQRTLDRLGGRLELSEAASIGGVCAKITLPLSMVLATKPS
jgi:two-component system, sensor histidine kinase RegB